MAFKNNIGDEIETVLTKVKDLEGFIEYIIQKRGYDKDRCLIIFGLDGGQKKLILTMIVVPDNDNEMKDKYKATEDKRTMIIAKADGVQEKYMATELFIVWALTIMFKRA